MHGPPDPTDFWAKLHPDYPEKTDWHPLLAHSADVAAVLEMLLRHTSLDVRMARLINQKELSEVQIQRLCVLAVLHDAGKANQGFQNRAFDRKPRDDHVTPMVGMLSSEEKWDAVSSVLGLTDMYPWFGDEWNTMDWLQTTWSHHGLPVSIERPKKGRWTDAAMERLSKFRGWTRQWYENAFDDAPPFDAPGLQHLFNGALTLADWIGSDTEFFELSPGLTDPDDAIDTARHRARNALQELGLVLDRDIDGSLPNILGGYEPYEIQKKIQALPISQEGTLSVLESATGSGKTEGALGRYAHLLEEGRVDSMFFAVPTRAAAKQLQKRIKKARDRIFGAEEPPVHLAVPGYLKVDDVEGTRFGWKVRWDENVGPRGWAAESSKRYTASPIAVGTVDQVLMSVLQRPHAHLRLAGLSRSFLVVDEVHASSVYMNELLQKVLSFHRKMGGHALLMSATLGSNARANFTGEELPDYEDAKDQHYPLLSHVNGSEITEPDKVDAPEGRAKNVSVELKGIMDEPEAIARRAEEAAADGAHVLVIRNTVKACRRVFGEVNDQFALRVETDDGKLATPHHSRYCAEDREDLDDRIETVYGKHEEGEGENARIVRKTDGRVITVATQTVEQSLDIDADILITDLCPMDVLLQRIGRLHRHDRDDRPAGYRDARCVVLTPENRDLKSVIDADSGKGFPGPGLGSVYADLRMIEATWRALEKRAGREDISIPRDNRTLVEEVTHPEVLTSIKQSDERWMAHARYLKKQKREEVLGAKNVQINRDRWFTAAENQFPDTPPKTRLGEEDIVVKLPQEMETPFGNTVEELTLSPYLFDSDERPENGDATCAEPTDDGFAFTFAGEDYTYTALGIQKQERS